MSGNNSVKALTTRPATQLYFLFTRDLGAALPRTHRRGRMVAVVAVSESPRAKRSALRSALRLPCKSAVDVEWNVCREGNAQQSYPCAIWTQQNFLRALIVCECRGRDSAMTPADQERPDRAGPIFAVNADANTPSNLITSHRGHVQYLVPDMLPPQKSAAPRKPGAPRKKAGIS